MINIDILYSAIAAVASGILGAMGMGGGGILMIYFSLFTDIEQKTAQGINILFFLPSALIAVIIYIKKKMIDKKTAIPFAISGMAGSVGGALLSGLLSGELLTKLFGCLLLYIGIKELLPKSRK